MTHNNTNEKTIAILTGTSPIVLNVATRGLLADETEYSFVLGLAKFKYQKICLLLHTLTQTIVRVYN